MLSTGMSRLIREEPAIKSMTRPLKEKLGASDTRKVIKERWRIGGTSTLIKVEPSSGATISPKSEVYKDKGCV